MQPRRQRLIPALLLPAALAGCWASFPDAPSADEGRGAAASTDGGPPADPPVAPVTRPPDLRPGGAPAPPAPSCADQDRDGVSTCEGDCDDHDADVHPGQESFFATPTASGSFDYDCNGGAELESAQLLDCSPGDCGGSAWLDAVPDCGQDGSWAQCQKSGGKGGKSDEQASECALRPLGEHVQRCR